MDIPTPFKNKKKKYMLVEPGRWGVESVLGMMELSLNDTQLNFNGDNYIITDIRPMFHNRLRNQGDIYLLYIMKHEAFNVGGNIDTWLESDDGKLVSRNDKIDSLIDE